MSETTIHEMLRQGTRDAHLRVERLVPILTFGSNRGAYCGYLARLLGFYAPMEASLGAHDWASIGIDFERRRKAPLLEADLVSLGLEAASVSSLPRCPSLPSLPDLPSALGCAYVLEGATLGGRVLARLLGEPLGLSRSQGAAFFLAYGDDHEGMWQTFVAGLEAAIQGDEEGARALDVARDTFERLGRWIEDDEGGSAHASSTGAAAG